MSLEKAKEDSVVVDFTYRRIRNNENFVRVNLTWNYKVAPHELPQLFFAVPGQEPFEVGRVEVLFQERAKHLIRFTGMMKETDFLQLVKTPHGALRVEADGAKLVFPTSQVFEKTLHEISVELS